MASSKQTTQTTQSATTNPWSVQAPYLSQAFQGASGALNRAQTNAVTPTQFTASYTPDQIAAFQAQQGYGMNAGTAASSATTGGALSTAGVGGVNAGLGGLSSFQPQGTTDSNIAAAMKYAGNQPIDAMTKAAMLSATQQANEVTNPGIDAQAAGSGNINSSRDAIQHGIVDRGLAQTAAGINANLQGQAYNTGLNLAEQQNESQNSNNLTKLMAQLSGGTSAANAGTAANTGSVADQQGLYGIANTGITGQNTAAQAPLTNAQQAFAANTNDPFAALQNFYNLIGANNWGSSSSGQGSSTTTSTPSTLSIIGGGINAAGSLLSDARAKTDIVNVGTLADGQNVYRYRYVGGQKWYLGLLAQEVEKLYPEAVTEIGGLKHVNYDLATREAAFS